MVVSENCKLVVNLKVYHFNMEAREYILRFGSLSIIDAYTYKFKNKYDFFDSVKNYIYDEIKVEFLDKVGIFPIEIELGEKGIYVLRGDNEYQALFSDILIGGHFYPLENIAIKKMLNGSLKCLYQMDKKRRMELGYQSLFEGIDESLLEILEVSSPSVSLCCYFYRELYKKRRFVSVLRILLTDVGQSDFDSLYEQFYFNVDGMEEIRRHDAVVDERKVYRCPYKND